MHTSLALAALLAATPEDAANLSLQHIPSEPVMLFALALLISAAGFYRLVYFVSIGYAFSIAAMAGLSAAIFNNHVDGITALQLAALFVYGVRLGTYLVKRELSPAYQRELEDVKQRGAGIGWQRKLLIWIAVSVLYVLMFSPTLIVLLARRQDAVSSLAWLQIAGVVVMLAGILMEGIADLQKSTFKRSQPHRFCDVGLYRFVRCPNYLGEIVFWLGQFVAGVWAFGFWGHWLASSIGLVCIVLIMMGSTKRLEGKQDERYGQDPAYQKYISSVPVLFPLLPIYSLKKVRVYLE